jgi:hypothetical protein
MLLRQMAGDDPDLFCVGDPNQSIYGFNGANPTLINEILATWPDTVVLDLTRNHRSTANIIAVANTLLEPGARGIEPAKDEGEVPLIRSYDTDEERPSTSPRGWRPNTSRAVPGTPWRCSRAPTRSWNWSPVTLDAANVPNERRGPEHSPASDLLAPEPTGRRLDEPDRDAVALSTIHRAKGTRVSTRCRDRLGRRAVAELQRHLARAVGRRTAPRLRRAESRRTVTSHHVESRAQRPALPRPLAVSLSRAH